MPRLHTLVSLAILVAGASGCVPKAPGNNDDAGVPAARQFEPINPDAAVFWDRQTTETADLLRIIAQEFNEDRTGLPVVPEYTGGYSDIFRKVTASIVAGKLPALAASYESMTSVYIQSGAVAPLDDFVNDPELGYTAEELEDFFPGVIEINRYPQFDNRMYSFPFCKSVLMMYFNEDVLREAGIAAPPRTWDEFLEQCRQVKARTGKFAYAINVDASTIDGMIYSMGGEVVDGSTTLFDSPESIRVFELLETLAKEKLCYVIPARTYDDEAAFAQDQIAFFLRSSSSRTSILRVMEGSTEGWGIAPIPQADPDNPRTVLYGPNVCIFNTTPEQQRVAWQFIKHFTSPDVAVRWSLGSGYVPIRKSAAEDPRMQAFWAEWKYNRAAFDCLPFARSEPNLVGWQQVREVIEGAEAAVLSGLKTGRQAALDLKKEADKVLAAKR